ncbi:glycosyltransferase [Rhodobacter sp. Har01]|uniref:glycosyltransferase n=1 Tax=Rhodobacter sp. Har01 TaxID=2883999 RepID=UPI001D067B57|nr:glycosyltransferase [Rhodobacter sp. Har01]MCB6178829.1 glycosyltransferase [Rhodobacter sp. Har01]
MTAPRVLHFHFGKEGGAERFFVNLAQALAARGVEQRFVIRPGRSWEADIAALGPVIRNNFSRISPVSLLAHLQVNALVRRWRPDAAMAWMPRAGRLMHPWPGVVKLARMGDFPENLKHFGQCDVLVGNVPGIARRCRDLGWKKPVLTISNFAREVAAVPVSRASLTTPEGAFLVAASGRFVQRKGFDVLIRAVARLPGAWLWLLGEGRERAALETLARDLGIADRVRFAGWVAEPIHLIAAADAFVMPSRHEPLGNTLLEAWAAGVPSVATRSEGPDWYMRDGIDGIVTALDDDVAIAAGLARIRDDAALAAGFVANARDRLAAYFSKDAVVDAYLRVFSGDFGG